MNKVTGLVPELPLARRSIGNCLEPMRRRLSGQRKVLKDLEIYFEYYPRRPRVTAPWGVAQLVLTDQS